MSSRNCRVPDRQHGASKVVRFRVFDFEGRSVRERLTVTERFRRLEGPEDVFDRLRPNQYVSDNGYFDDCYRFAQPAPIPTDFRLKVEQNHMVANEVISQQHITYTGTGILVCIFQRRKGEHDFGARCRNF